MQRFIIAEVAKARNGRNAMQRPKSHVQLGEVEQHFGRTEARRRSAFRPSLVVVTADLDQVRVRIANVDGGHRAFGADASDRP